MPDVETRGRDLVTRATRLTHAPSIVTSGVDRFGDGQTIVRYAQTHRGLPVIGRGASVHFSSTGKPIATRVDLEDALPAQVTPRVSDRDAAAITSARSTFAASSSDARLVVWPTRDRGARLAWAVLPRIPAGLPTLPRIIVDGETGEILEARDLVTFAKAKVFPSNPAKSPATTEIDLPMAPDGTTLSNAFLQSSNCVDNKTVKPVDFFGFKADVHVCDLVQTAAPNASGDYVYEPTDEAGSAAARSDTFSEVSMYFHASKAYAFFRDLQGKADAQVVEDKPLRVIANLQIPQGIASGDLSKASDPNLALSPFQNAFFAPAGGGLGQLFQQLYGFEAGALWFGQGPLRDYAYDGDVVYHELTHAVVDATLKLGAWHIDARGAIDSPGAMNEGLADYFSSAITGDPDVGEYAATDFGEASGPIRTLANQDGCAKLQGEVHIDSTGFSGALWSARTSLSPADQAKFDAALYKAMRAHVGSGDLGFEDLAKLFLDTLATELPAGATALEAKMTERGFLPACERIATFSGAAHVAPDDRIGFVAPGKQLASVKGLAPGVFQLTANVPENTASVTVSFVVRRSGGGTSPFGGTAKPFSPVVLAKIGAPITWDPKSSTGHDATFKVSVTPEGGNGAAVIALPEGTPAGAIYVQIANAGDSDGAYDKVALAFTAVPTPPAEETPPTTDPAPAPAADTGCTAAPVGAGRGSTRTSVASEASGGSTRTTSTTVVPGALAAGALLVALRRRRRER